MTSMSPHPATARYDTGEDLELAVRETRRHLRRLWLIAGIALWIMTTTSTLLMMIGIDLLVPLPVVMRVVFCAVLGLVSLGCFVVAIVWPLCHPPSLWAVARQIEQTLEPMHNRLVSVLDLRQREMHDELSQRVFFIRLLEQTRTRMQHFKREKVVSKIRMRNAVISSVMALMVLTSLMLLFPQSVPTAIARMLMPTADIPPVTGVQFESPGEINVLQGESVTLSAKLVSGQLETMILRLRKQGGKWHHYPMASISPSEFTFTIERLDRTYEYQFLGGGTWTRVYPIHAIRRPVVSNISLSLTLPDYTRQTEPIPIQPDTTQVDALIGSSLNCSITVEGDVQEGRAVFYDLITTTSQVVADKRRIWIEDSFPADATVLGDVQWQSTLTMSGTHAFEVKGNEPGGLVTKFSTQTVVPGADLVFQVFLPEDRAPEQMAVSFKLSDQWRKIVLMTDAAYQAMGDERDQQFYQVGRLPQPGAWVEIRVDPSDLMRTKIQEPITLQGMSVQLDRGKAYIDQVGTLIAETRDVTTTEMVEIANQPLQFNSDAQTWQGSLPVNHDFHVRFEFENKLGYPNQPGQAIHVVTMQDAYPSILIERPGKNLTVEKDERVAVVARGFDDYGIASLALRSGPSKSKLDRERTIETVAGIETSRTFVTTIDPEKHKMQPGETLFYQFSITDLRSQDTLSEIQRITIASQDREKSNVWEKQTASLNKALRALSRIQESAKLMDTQAELLQTMFEPSNTSTNKLLEMINEDGTPLTADELQAVLDEHVDQLNKEDQQKLWEAERQLAEQQDQKRQAKRELAQALKLEAQSPMSTPTSQAALSEMQQTMRDMLQEQPEIQVDQRLTAQELEAMQALEDDQENLATLEQKLTDMQQARENMSHDPQRAEQQLQQLITQMQAERAQQGMQRLADFVQNQQHNLNELSQRQKQLQDQALQANTAKQLAKTSDQQQQLDPETLEAIAQANQLLEAMMQNRERQNELEKLAPWAPPVDRREALPVEQDTPDPEADMPDEKQLREKLEEDIKALEADMNWWEQAVEAPLVHEMQQAPERFAERLRDVDTPQRDAALSPRQMLQEHQQNMQQALTRNQENLRKQSAEIAELQQKLDAIQQQLQGQSAASSQTAESPPSAQASNEASKQQPAQIAMQKFAQIMRSSEMKRVQMMSQRAMNMLRPQASQPSSQQATALEENGTGDQLTERLEPGIVVSVELPDLPADQKMKLYRLPPSVRQPLIQGMQQRGPEGYQPLIDAYYRELTQEQQ